jgi:NADP-dependent aldehyde dehydrogenase
MQTTGAAFVAHPALQQEHFGPVTLLVFCRDAVEREQVVEALHGSLTATVQGLHEEAADAAALFALLREKAGRLIWNGFPTGVEVAGAQVHGGPYPATTAPATTSVGLTAIERFMRPVAWQGVPDALLPPALQNANPLGILRWVDGIYTRESLG